ncbi:MAG: aromatic aminobenezylarsenical efflux permease ArsG family transporter [Bacteroidales bacterium]|nr:aromatic aminobenezylarsenical efflux permease ArsG family transporter [Bacteroidales bacterium]
MLEDLMHSTDIAWITALLLGIIVSLSPCPLATNIAAISYLGRDLQDKKKIFINGIYYSAGRIITYTFIAALLFLGASQFNVARILQLNGEKFIVPLLFFIGILMPDILPLSFSIGNKLSEKLFTKASSKNKWFVVLMGIMFALAFCPYSGAMYFGMLIPLTFSSKMGLLLPIIFGFATALPVIIFSYIIAFSVASLAKVFNAVKIFEFLFRKISAIIFIGVGIYFTWLYYLK